LQLEQIEAELINKLKNSQQLEKAALGQLEDAITNSHSSSQKRIVGQKEKIEKQRKIAKPVNPNSSHVNGSNSEGK
jgi:hypothetical protein